jgi:MYXO-CTERM domain-containing protein
MKRLLLAATAVVAFAAAAPANALTFNYTGSIVTWVAPTTGTYEIVATGAQGGLGTAVPNVSGGLGALIGGYFTLTGGTVLEIAVGGMGISGFGAGGGGGGSFVVRDVGDVPLVIAGGGGGVRASASQNGWNANIDPEGLSGSGLHATGGGVPLGNFGSGGGLSLANFGSGGGGFLYNGVDDTGFGTGGTSWANGLVGGVALVTCGSPAPNGGFGGGGAATDCYGAGGGGGYSGGQGGVVAGGGGSYNADQITGWAVAGAGIGNGLVTINLVGGDVSTPEPASATIALLGLFGLAALRRRR